MRMTVIDIRYHDRDALLLLLRTHRVTSMHTIAGRLDRIEIDHGTQLFPLQDEVISYLNAMPSMHPSVTPNFFRPVIAPKIEEPKIEEPQLVRRTIFNRKDFDANDKTENAPESEVKIGWDGVERRVTRENRTEEQRQARLAYVRDESIPMPRRKDDCT